MAEVTINTANGVQIFNEAPEVVRQVINVPAHAPEKKEDIIIKILRADSSEFKALFSKADEQYSKMDENEVRQKIQIYVDQEIDSEAKKQNFKDKVTKSVYNIATSFVGSLLLEVLKLKVFGA